MGTHDISTSAQNDLPCGNVDCRMTKVFLDVVFTVPGMSMGKAPWRAGVRAVAVVV
jgi:hypothetical protein